MRDAWVRAEEKAQSYIQSNPFRIKMIVESRPTENDEWRFYSYQEIEQAGPDRTRIRYQKGYYEEVIIIDNTSYSRRPFSDWVTKTRDSEDPSVATVRSLTKPETVYSTVGDQSTSGEPTKGFQIATKAETLNLASGIIDKIPGTYQWWFDQEGRFHRFQSVIFTSSAPGPRYIRTTRDYEYDPDIRIEAPLK